MGADPVGEPEPPTVDRGHGPLHQDIPQTAEIREGAEHRARVGGQHEELQEFGPAVHRVEERGDEGQTLETIDDQDRTVFRYGPGEVRRQRSKTREKLREMRVVVMEERYSFNYRVSN